MKPTRIVVRRDPSAIATCQRVISKLPDPFLLCGAPMQLVIKEPKTWSYQERISERCIAGHIAHAQAVVVESGIEEGC